MDISSVKNLLKLAFGDLKELSAYDNDIFKDFYYNRKRNFETFSSILQSSTEATNVLIIGDAGVGKSCFIHKLLSDKDTLDENKLFPVVIDYRDVIPNTKEGCLLTFISEMEKYFDKIEEYSINDLKDIDMINYIDYNVRKIAKHLCSAKDHKWKKRLIIFLDDFDYAENEWFYLLKYFLPFASSTKISLVLTVRPPLLAGIKSYDDRFDAHYIKNVHKIDLEALEVDNIITSRLAPFILKQNSRIPLHSFFNKHFSKDNSLYRIITQIGIKDIENLDKVDYPMTNKHNMFMHRITNGNLREIFNIAMDSLIYIFDNFDKLENRNEDGLDRKVIGREGVMELFSGTYKNKLSDYELLNINKYTSKRGNSLLYNVIEAIKIMPYIDENFYDKLKKLGHSEKQISFAINFLCDKSNRLIYPVKILPTRKEGDNLLNEEYVISEKGDYYLQIAKWEEYQSKCGSFGESFIKRYTL